MDDKMPMDIFFARTGLSFTYSTKFAITLLPGPSANARLKWRIQEDLACSHQLRVSPNAATRLIS
ncbi:hypothetical protein [Verminephrobacter aporrectodeae]|uniref:hypothetical protein n=1 Tax=Verminephrobacter aporrectodeae TaxID=1110389 RepID=UPI002238389F|nr:hypothetical protein [Verminephrobacter aporrectodeae]